MGLMSIKLAIYIVFVTKCLDEKKKLQNQSWSIEKMAYTMEVDSE